MPIYVTLSDIFIVIYRCRCTNIKMKVQFCRRYIKFFNDDIAPYTWLNVFILIWFYKSCSLIQKILLLEAFIDTNKFHFYNFKQRVIHLFVGEPFHKKVLIKVWTFPMIDIASWLKNIRGWTGFYSVCNKTPLVHRYLILSASLIRSLFL